MNAEDDKGRVDFPSLRRAMADLQSNGRLPEAAAWLARAVRQNGADVETRLDLVGIFLLSHDLAGAARTLKDALAVAPGDLRLQAKQRQVGLALQAAGLWEDAEPWLAAATRLERWDKPLAQIYQRIRRPSYLGPDPVDRSSGRALRRYAAREGEAYIYVIDVVGTCNLRCPTCPVGNSQAAERPIGFMPFELFDRIVAKIRTESPSPRPIVNLYNWGEPLLHPELPRMIARLRALGMRSQLSTNLNIKRGLEEVIAANADELKISISGFTAESYARMHRRGRLDLVKDNMRRVREYADKHKATTRIWVGHHLYRSTAAQSPDVRRFCEELGFAYHPIAAFYMPLERLIDCLDGAPPAADADILADLPRSPVESAAAAARLKSGDFDCELRFNQTVINHDGSVALCCTVYEKQNMLGVNFLDENFAQIEERKYAHPFCGECYRRKLEYAPAELARIAP